MVIISCNLPPALALSEAIFKKGVWSFLNGSAPGPSGLCPNYVHKATDCPSPDRGNHVMFCLIKFVNHLFAGVASFFISPHLGGANLLAINKNEQLRPIAVGEVLCRLVSKYLAIATCPTAFSLLSLLQLGLGSKIGCDAIIYASLHLMSTSSTHRP